MPLRAANWPELVIPGLSEAFSLNYGRRPSLIPSLYSVRSSNRVNEIHLPYGAIGSLGWGDFEKTGRAQSADFNRGYKWTTTHAEFARSLQVQRKLLDDDMFNVVNDQSGFLGDSAYRFREKAGAAVFNNATTASGTDAYGFPIAGADAVALCSASHPRSPDDSSTTDSNTSNTTLTAANISTVRKNMIEFVDDRGDLLSVMPDTILVAPELEDTALIACRSVNDPNSANHAINPQAGRFNVVVWAFLTNNASTNWFMIDSSMMKQALLWYDRVPLEYTPSAFNAETQSFNMIAYMRFSRGFRDWRWVYLGGS